MEKPLVNIFANSPLDRATHRRTDAKWLAQAEQEGLLLPMWRGQIFTTAPNALGFLRTGLIKPALNIGMIFLGVDKKDKPYFACALDDESEPKILLEMGNFLDLRELAPQAPAGDCAIAAQARALVEWHKNHLFCGQHGGETKVAEGGHKRLCVTHGCEHFPRTDPVVIMMITCGEKAFLGRQASWPRGFFSALAGFIEPGETIEEAVARESYEEAQIKIIKTSYHSTQPWPYPYSLMIGCFAEAESCEYKVDGVEIEEGRWFERAELKALLEGTGDKDTFLPPPVAIARRLIHSFAFASSP